MSVSFDAPHVETHGKVLQFPGSAAAAKTLKSGLRKYWTVGALIIGVLLIVIGTLFWFLGTKSSVQYVTTQVTRGTVARTFNGDRYSQSRSHDHCRDLRFRRDPRYLLRLQHSREGGPGLRQD